MTFLCTYDGKVEPGYQDGHARTIERDGSTYYHWPQPWYFDCDFCGRRFPYGCVAISDPGRSCDRRPSARSTPGPRAVGDDKLKRHRCAYCEGYVDEPTEAVQLELEVV
jgi:hypothetical protein